MANAQQATSNAYEGAKGQMDEGMKRFLGLAAWWPCCFVAFFALAVVWALPLGCHRSLRQPRVFDRSALRDRAFACLKAGVRYSSNPAVRVEAVEALEAAGDENARLWIRSALLDGHPAVRFAACMALGRLKDINAKRRLRECVEDEDPSVQVAALFALHRLGNTEGTGRIATYLLRHGEPTVRRNAAMALGLLEEPGAVKILARAMRDSDAGVRHHALEAMARLGSREARQELTFMTNAGVGSEEVFALSALAETRDPYFLETFRYKLNTATHLETRLAAARGLGLLDSDEGFATALDALEGNATALVAGGIRKDPEDSPAAHVLRVRQMAAAALGAIGSREALPALTTAMNDSSDPRVQVSAAKAALQILEFERNTGRAIATEVRPAGASP